MSRSVGSGTPAWVESFVILGLGELEVTLLETLKVASSGSTPAIAPWCDSPGSTEWDHRETDELELPGLVLDWH